MTHFNCIWIVTQEQMGPPQWGLWLFPFFYLDINMSPN